MFSVVVDFEFLLQTMSDMKQLQHEQNEIEGTATKNTCCVCVHT